MKGLVGDVGDRKVPGNVRLTPESGDNLLVQIGRQWDRDCIFVGLRPDCVQRLVRQSPCQDVPRVLLRTSLSGTTLQMPCSVSLRPSAPCRSRSPTAGP